jgi:F-type H+-transporting ATPase subunit gamma
LATVREIKRRIGSIRNIAQVTRAMQAVSASKMRRAEEQTLASRPYADKAWEMLTFLASQYATGEEVHPLLHERELVKAVALILITPDRGLCGGLPTNMIRKAMQFIRDQPVPVHLITVGRKGRDFMSRYGQQLHATFAGIPDQPSMLDITPIGRLVLDDFLAGVFDQVYLGYTDFINVLRHEPVIRRLLPIVPAEVTGWSAGGYIFEPNPEALLSVILPRFTQLQIYQAVLEAQASEHSARMIAMRNASENADDLVGNLTLIYNKARQEAITTEMMDIVGGAEALARARAMAG